MTDETAASDQSLEVCVQTPPPALLAKKVTRKNLARVQEKHLLRNIDALMATLFPALIKKVKDGNIQAIRLTAEIANLVKTQGGVTISQTIMQANSNSADGGARFSFDALARKLDGRDSSAAAVIDVTPE
jgi:hypothetical protein